MIGRRLLHYEITEKLGEGGMGVVYKARDTHLDRFVAIKVLPPERVADPSRKARFVQEAKAASALNHPNIITVHDITADGGTDFIAMEYVAGKTLDQLIPRKGMRLNEVLKIAVQITDALARAHGAGIVHRDLKPSNVMLDQHGLVKVLDFGLAKLTQRETSEDASTATIGVKTDEGVIIGTAAYMSPEQAEGKPVDARSDIFSFGAVLYEMVTGQRAFHGDSKMSTLSAVLHKEPPPLGPEIPHDLAKLVARCLRKDPDKRFHHMVDVRVALEELKEESDFGRLTPPTSVAGGRSRWRSLRWLALAIAVLAAAWGVWMWRAPGESPEAFREMPFTADPGFETNASFSPDGLAVAYQKLPPAEQWGSAPPQPAVMVKLVGTESSTLLKESAISPVWSPDGRWIAFGLRPNWFTSQRTSLCIMPRVGGTERKIADVTPTTTYGPFVAWTPDSRWLITMDRDAPDTPFHLVLVLLDSGEKRRLTNPPAKASGDFGPALSPDGKTLAFYRRAGREPGLYLLSLDASYLPAAQPRKLDTGVPNSNWPVWTRDGREIIFCSDTWAFSTLWRVRADGSGPARRIPFGGQGAYQPALARTGDRLVYTKHTWDMDIWRVELLPSGQAAGAPEKFIYSNRADFDASWSPDGNTIAFVSERTGRSQIWLCDSHGGGLRALTSIGLRLDMEPCWSPDGESIAFHAAATGNRDVYVVDLRGGAPRNLTSDPADDFRAQWSPDGKYIYFHSSRSGGDRVWKVAKDGGPAVLETRELPDKLDPGGAGRFFLRSEAGRLSIWREPPGDGAATKLADDVAERGFAVSSKGLYYVPRGPDSNPWHTGIAFLELSSGRSTRVAELRPHLGMWANTRPSVSPDGRYLLYTQYAEETNDLMLVENFR